MSGAPAWASPQPRLHDRQRVEEHQQAEQQAHLIKANVAGDRCRSEQEQSDDRLPDAERKPARIPSARLTMYAIPRTVAMVPGPQPPEQAVWPREPRYGGLPDSEGCAGAIRAGRVQRARRSHAIGRKRSSGRKLVIATRCGANEIEIMANDSRWKE